MMPQPSAFPITPLSATYCTAGKLCQQTTPNSTTHWLCDTYEPVLKVIDCLSATIADLSALLSTLSSRKLAILVSLIPPLTTLTQHHHCPLPSSSVFTKLTNSYLPSPPSATPANSTEPIIYLTLASLNIANTWPIISSHCNLLHSIFDNSVGLLCLLRDTK